MDYRCVCLYGKVGIFKCGSVGIGMLKPILFAAMAVPAVVDYPQQARLITGNPRRETWTMFEDASVAMSCGVWACEVGCWRIQFSPQKAEFFYVLTGRVRLWTPDDAFFEVGPGEAAVIPAGFVGKFEVLEPVKKYFVVVSPTAVESSMT